MRRARGLVCAAAMALTVSAVAAPRGVMAQDLARAERLVDESRVEEAREELMEWWAERGMNASREQMQQALWLRGVLTLDGTQAMVDFTRLVVEFPGGSYTDRALLRLAQAAEVRGDSAAARRHYRVLATDFPSSPLRVEARSWLARADGAAEGGGGAEAGGDRAVDPSVGDARTPSRRAAAGSSAPATVVASFAVQVGAFGDVDRARVLAGRLEADGWEPRLVRTPGRSLVRVRLGRFTTEDEAVALRRRLEEAGVEAIVVDDVAREREAGG